VTPVQTKGSTGDLLIEPFLLKARILHRGEVLRALPNTERPQEMPEPVPAYVTAHAEPDNFHK